MEWRPEVFPDIPHYKGPPLVGFIIGTLLFGCSVHSFIDYLQFSYATDRTRTRVAVCAAGVAAFITMGFSLVSTTRHYAMRFGLKPNPADGTWDSLAYLLGGIAHVIVAGFFAHRAWRLFDRPVYLAVILGTFILSTFVGCVGATAIGIMSGPGVRSTIEDVFNYILFISQLAADLVITALISTKLYRSKTGWKSTDSMIHRLVLISIETQAPPALMAVSFLITYVGAPYVTYILAFAFIPQLYYLCFFAAMNSRHVISSRMKEESTAQRMDDVGSRRTLPTSINVTTETYTNAEPAASFAQMRRPHQRGAGKIGDSSESLRDESEDSKDLNTSEIRLV